MNDRNIPPGMTRSQARLLGYGIVILTLLLGCLIGWEAIGMPGV